MRTWHPTPLTTRQQRRREVVPIVIDGCVVNGCLPKDDYDEEIYQELQNDAVSFSTLWESGDMPVLKMDDTFRRWRQGQIEACKALTAERVTCLLPWQVLKHLPINQKKSNRLYWSQGGLGSCMGRVPDVVAAI